jgi:predicted methyltransferase
MTPSQINAAQLLGKAVLETIEESGSLGAPSGVLYAALSSKGVSLSIYQQMIASMGKNGFVTESDHCLHITKVGKEFLTKLKIKFDHQPEAA